MDILFRLQDILILVVLFLFLWAIFGISLVFISRIYQRKKDKRDYRSLYKNLLKLQIYGPINRRLGICSNIPDYNRSTCIQLFLRMGLDPVAPVQHPTLSPSDAYCFALDKWDFNEYGNNRRALLKSMIRFIEEHHPDALKEN